MGGRHSEFAERGRFNSRERPRHGWRYGWRLSRPYDAAIDGGLNGDVLVVSDTEPTNDSPPVMDGDATDMMVPTEDAAVPQEDGMVPAFDEDGDGSPQGEDCDDSDPEIFPGAFERAMASIMIAISKSMRTGLNLDSCVGSVKVSVQPMAFWCVGRMGLESPAMQTRVSRPRSM